MYLHLGLSEKGSGSELPPQLASHWLVAAACPAHRHISSMPWVFVITNLHPSVHFSRSCQLVRNVLLLHIKKLTGNSLWLLPRIFLVARLASAANISTVKMLYASETLADAVARNKIKVHQTITIKFSFQSPKNCCVLGSIKRRFN